MDSNGNRNVGVNCYEVTRFMGCLHSGKKRCDGEIKKEGKIHGEESFTLEQLLAAAKTPVGRHLIYGQYTDR